MTGDTRRRTVDPQHRARDGSLLGFFSELNPTQDEWAVDRINIIINGTWDRPPNELVENSFSIEDFFREHVGIPTVDWFTAPTMEFGGLTLSTRKPERSTLGHLKLTVKPSTRVSGPLKLAFQCNPTRTLANILADAPPDVDLVEHLQGLEIENFFAAADTSIRKGLDGNTNWLLSPREARRRLGGSIGQIFLPIFVLKLYNLTARLFAISSVSDGTDQLITYENGVNVRLRWGNLQIPQIESYFERYHSSAKVAVQRAGMKILAADYRTTVTSYPGNIELEREADCVKIQMTISDMRKMIVYAKTDTRIRFEIRRDSKGRYTGLRRSRSPMDRLLNIIEFERSEAARPLIWANIGRLFDNVDGPSLQNLTEFFATVTSIASETGASIATLIRVLLIDGSISEGNPEAIPKRTISRLIREGIVVKLPLRNRELHHAIKRYPLAEQHHDLREHILSLFNPRSLVEEIAEI